MSVLSGNDIRRLISGVPPLVEGWVDLPAQVQANGFDLTLRDIAVMQSAGAVTADNRRRAVSELSPLLFDTSGGIDLIPGIYIITYNEIVHLPKNIMALGRPRSSLLRCGVNVGTAVWDAGYEGRSQSLLVVYNYRGFRVEKNARVTQLVFFELTGESEGYNGVYQGENI
ncbi:MAG: deoxyuridine 5'-triphosphate nucleotidohydrolase [Chloroflexi bacterium RBG_16_56_11]|nr:MAG: deoxyuridine 5'-triphosphate nucleotidohydrolase [Chloroflexi bacterium RBG_16_56_11]HJX13680.1 deoxyuridine 5'-triphosphate nucleotidohydrolase [Dehalococcoidales bacterium]